MNHIAIIMDGNSRWAEQVGMSRFDGHKAGAKNVKKTIKYVLKNKIKHLSLFAFSTENWQRPKGEVDYLMYLLQSYLESEVNNLIQNKIQLSIIGDLSRLSQLLQDKIHFIHKSVVINEPVLNLYITFSYGGKQEIVDAVKQCIMQKTNQNDLTVENFQNFLYAPNMPDVDFIIRTGGRRRISNFLLWHIPYAEMYFSDKYWPDFSEQDLDDAIKDYHNRIRTFGKR